MGLTFFPGSPELQVCFVFSLRICVGINDDPIHCRTHLGHVLNIGDSVLGLDLKNSNVNNPELEKLPTDKVGLRVGTSFSFTVFRCNMVISNQRIAILLHWRLSVRLLYVYLFLTDLFEILIFYFSTFLSVCLPLSS